jgi:hypothetical protein
LEELGWASVGFGWEGSEERGIGLPAQFGLNPFFFFCKAFSDFVFSKPFANLVAVLKLFENSNLLKIFKCSWNL